MELCRLRKGGSEGRRFFFRRAGEGRLPGQYRLQFGPKRKQAAEKKATQDAPLLRFASQPIDETSWNGMLRALCAVRMPGTSQGASIQAQWTLAWSCSPSIGSDRSAQRTTYGQEARNGGQQNEILIEMQLTQFFNRSTTLSLHLLKLSNVHVTS